jgi:hypothetical protein
MRHHFYKGDFEKNMPAGNLKGHLNCDRAAKLDRTA